MNKMSKLRQPGIWLVEVTKPWKRIVVVDDASHLRSPVLRRPSGEYIDTATLWIRVIPTRSQRPQTGLAARALPTLAQRGRAFYPRLCSPSEVLPDARRRLLDEAKAETMDLTLLNNLGSGAPRDNMVPELDKDSRSLAPQA